MANLRAVGLQCVLPAVAAGAVVGAVLARKVAMTAMPQMVALFNGMGAGAAALMGIGDYRDRPAAAAASAPSMRSRSRSAA